MSEEQNVDFVEVFHDALGGVLGRVFGLMSAFSLGCVVVVLFTRNDYYDFQESMELFMLGLAGSILTGLGVVAFPLLLLFAVAFVRYDWPYWSLIVPLWAPWIFYTPPF